MDKFRGSNTPSVYIIDFNLEEGDNSSPLLGSRGNYVSSLLGSYNLLPEVRIVNWYSVDSQELKLDIVSTKPKVIISLGEGVLGNLIFSPSISSILGKVIDISVEGFSTKLIPLDNPSNIIDHPEGDKPIEFAKGLYKAVEIINGTYRDILKEKTLLVAHTYDEFVSIYNSNFINDSILSYDIETNARPAMMKGSKIIGFSISNDTTGVYVSHDSLEVHTDQSEIDKIWDFLINEVFEKKDKLVIHNTMYERPYTYYCKGYEIGFDKAEDTLVLARLLKGSKERAGLKYQAQQNLNYPDWESDLDSYISGVQGFINRVGLGPKKYQSLYYGIINKGISIFKINDSESYSELTEIDKQEIDNLVSQIKSVLISQYTDDEIEELGVLISKKVKEATESGGIKDSVIPYNWIPDKVLCKYGAMDALSTYELYNYFINKLDSESTDKVDLHKGYHNWLEHMYVAYIMERNGMYWDDKLAQHDREVLVSKSTECLRSMLLSPLFDFAINDVCESIYKPIILSDYLPEIALSQGYEVSYNKDTEEYILTYQGRRVAKGRISDIEIYPAYTAEYDKLIRDMFYEEVYKASSYEDLKKFYNPASSTSSHIPKHILMTPEVQMGGIITSLQVLADSPEMEGVIDSLPNIDKKFLDIAKLLCSPDELKNMYGDRWATSRKEMYQGFCSLYNNYKSKVTTQEIIDILNNLHSVNIEHFDDEGMVTLYNNLVPTGIDQDDPTTWTPEFEWLINYRLYKKCSKIITSYIDGSVGRQSVAVVDKKSVSSGDHCVERKRRYYEGSDASYVPCNDDEDYLVMAKWSPNTAETGRWRSPQHTIPWNSPVKKYYPSRFKGGTTCCLDGSTEVYLLSGERVSISELAKRSNNSSYVLSYDEYNHRIIPAYATNFRKTGEATQMIRITLQDNSVIRCTLDHKFYEVNLLKWVEAQDLSLDSQLACTEDFVTTASKILIKDIQLEILNQAESVYCCTVDTTHNFVLGTGLVSHNCPDYSQMEVRTLGAIAHDENMLELFRSGKDFHSETAKKIYRKDEVTAAERRFSKTATFSLLYGSTEDSFAQNYCKGDMEYAHMVYQGFFDAYPDVKRWVDERHEEVARDHRVSLELSGRFINITQKDSSIASYNSMMRRAQNFPIQAQSADLTGCVIFDLQKYIEDNNLKSLIFMYVHDSIEVDIYPYELLQFIAKLKILLNESPKRRMGLPSKADVALGRSLGHEIELEDITMNEDMVEGILSLKGYKDEIDDTVETWKLAYKTVEIYDEEYTDEFVSMGEMFIPKKAYTPSLGTTRHKGTCKVHINYYE